MRNALYDQAKRAVQEYPKGREATIRRDNWLWGYPAQVGMMNSATAAKVPVLCRCRVALPPRSVVLVVCVPRPELRDEACYTPKGS